MDSENIAVITGASSGIGFEISSLLIKKNFKIYAITRRKPNLECEWVETDFNDPESVQKSINYLTEKCKKINVIFHCAGVMLTKKSNSIDLNSCLETFKVNAIAPIAITSSLIKGLSRGKGTVITLSSIAGDLTLPGELVYSSSKAALKKAFGHFAAELTRLGIKFITVSPGLINTPMTEHLTDDQRDFMKTKISFKGELNANELAKFCLSLIHLPLETSGSTMYFGGIKK